MRTLRPPFIVLGVLCVGFLVWIACSAAWLPERVAVHFGSSGEANGWMTRSSHLLFIGALGVGGPLLFAGLVLLIGWIPAQFINVPSPHKSRRASLGSVISDLGGVAALA